MGHRLSCRTSHQHLCLRQACTTSLTRGQGSQLFVFPTVQASFIYSANILKVLLCLGPSRPCGNRDKDNIVPLLRSSGPPIGFPWDRVCCLLCGL